MEKPTLASPLSTTSGDELYVQTSNSNVFDLGRVASLASGDAGIVSLFAAAGSATGLAADTGNLYVVQYANVLSLPKTGAGSLGLVQQSPSSDSVVGPVSRDEILQKIWGLEAAPTNRTVDNFIVKLRKKVEKHPDKPVHILTVYGYGYKLAALEPEA